jgi:hypothetical protein
MEWGQTILKPREIIMADPITGTILGLGLAWLIKKGIQNVKKNQEGSHAPTGVLTERQVFQVGERAYWDGFLMDENPFPWKSWEYRVWEDGWMNGMFADKGQDKLDEYLRNYTKPNFNGGQFS